MADAISAAQASLAVDIGGTFTDAVLFSGAGIYVDKALTTPDDLLDGFFGAVHAALGKAGLTAAEVAGTLVHATTVVTNALIERKGARTGLVLTKGFADILEIRHERRYDMYDVQIEFPEPLVAAEDVFTIDERIYADGTVGRGIDSDEVDELCRWLVERDIETVGVCFLHSYKNPANEQRLARELRRRLPALYVSLSSEIAPQIREYQRTSTTAVNAFAVPITLPYLGRLENRLGAESFPNRPLIMLSSGGVVGAATAGRMPVRMIESGPAAGALGAAYAARALGLESLLSFDMGGTTAKVCLIQSSRPLVTGSFEIDRMYRFKEGSGLPVSVPCVDLIEIGAGGGSIAHVNELGLMNVGPRSAGAKPGPACYGLGGSAPTVTDADVALGIIDPENFLGGAMRLSADRAHAAIEALGARLGTSARNAARGVYRLVCETMASAVKAHASDRGVDCRGIPLLAFGGAGPVHACEMADLLHSRTVIFPPLASVYSAFGTLVTPARLDLVRSGLSTLGKMDWREADRIFADMEEEGRQALIQAGCAEPEIEFRYAADLRYLGQHYDLLVELEGRPAHDDAAAMLRRRFEEEYVKRYRITQDDVEVEVVNWRLAASGKVHEAPPLDGPAPASDATPGARAVHLWADDQSVPVMPRAALRALDSVSGPVIFDEPDTTLLIPPGWTATAGEMDCVVARRP